MNKVITIEKDDERYEEMINLVGKATTDNLIIVAKSHENRKAMIKPIMVRHGIYFYVASQIDNALIYSPNYTDEDIEIAKANTIRNAVIGDMMTIINGEGTSLRDWTPDDPMNVITTSGGANGAGILLCTDYLRRIFNKIGDYYILPSSIHEIIVVPKESWPGETTELSKMVREINAGYVDDEDVLADECFEYSDWI